jgi:uncharacterized protein HemY
MMYAQLARMALDDGDNQAAVRTIQDNMAIDPTQIIFVELINDLAIKDRAAADKLILECISTSPRLDLRMKSQRVQAHIYIDVAGIP